MYLYDLFFPPPSRSKDRDVPIGSPNLVYLYQSISSGVLQGGFYRDRIRDLEHLYDRSTVFPKKRVH